MTPWTHKERKPKAVNRVQTVVSTSELGRADEERVVSNGVVVRRGHFH